MNSQTYDRFHAIHRLVVAAGLQHDDPSMVDGAERLHEARHTGEVGIYRLDDGRVVGTSPSTGEAVLAHPDCCTYCGHPVAAEGVTLSARADVDRVGIARPRCSDAACEC